MYTDPKSINLLTQDEILALPCQVVPENAAHKTGIYFLLKSDNIVYIGMSEDLIQYRIHRHYIEKPSGSFERYTSIDPPHWNIPLAEALYIHRYKPALNRAYPYIQDLAWKEKPYRAMSEIERLEFDKRERRRVPKGIGLSKEEWRRRIMGCA